MTWSSDGALRCLSVNMLLFVYFVLTSVLTSAARPIPASQMNGSLGSGTVFAPDDVASTDILGIEVDDRDSVTATAITSTSPQPVPSTASVRRKPISMTLKPFDQSVSVPPSSIVYPDSLFKRIGVTLSHHVRALLHGDAITALGVPRLAYDAELIMTGPKAGRLPIGEPLATTSTSRIFAVLNDAFRVVKYQHNCYDLGNVHPLLRDYIFLQELAGSGLAPAAQYLSPPVRVPASVTPKTAFGMRPANRASCAENEGGQIRFMVMERVLWTLDNRVWDLHRIGRRFPVRHSIHLTASLIKTIQRLHGHGIVHGDVHWGNVAMVERGDRQILNLIDFGNAMFVDEMHRLPIMAREPRSVNHCLLSHWNIEGYRISFRDDVFRALLVGAFLINGMPFSDLCVYLETNVEEMLRFKREGFIFSTPSGPDRIDGLDFDTNTKRFVRRRLFNALNMARSVEGIDERPNYDFIISQLMAAVRVLTAPGNH